MSTRRSRLRRWLVVIALTLVLLVGGGIVFLRVRFSGPALADTLDDMLNEDMRGQVHVRSIDWNTSDLTKVVTGGWIPLTMEDVNIDDELGKRVLHADHVSLELDIHALMFGRHDLVIRHVVLDSGSVVLEAIPQPYPLHAYDTTVISLFDAFMEKHKTGGFHFGVTAGAPAILEVQDFTVKNMDVQIAMGTDSKEDAEGVPHITGHAFTADCHDVNGGGFVFADASDPLVPKLYFSMPTDEDNPIHAASATVTVLDMYTFDLDDVDLRRLAQLPKQWPHDPVANDLDFHVTGTSKQGAKIDLDGSMLGYWDSPYGGNYDAKLTIENAGGLAHDVINDSMGGDHLTIEANASGPILFPKFEAHLSNLEYSAQLREGLDPLKLYLDSLNVEFDLATDTGTLDQTQGRVLQPNAKTGDGIATISANFSLPLNVDANIQVPAEHPIDLAYFLPPIVPKAFGSMFWGTLDAHGDSSLALQVDGLGLHLGRLRVQNQKNGGLFMKNKLEDWEATGIVADAGDTHVVVNGNYHNTPGKFSFDVDVDSGDLNEWLPRLGAPAIAKTAHTLNGKHLVIDGTLDAPAARGELALGGVPYVDDLDTTFDYGGQRLTIADARSHSIGDIRAHGAVDLRGTPKADNLVVTGSGVDLSRAGAGPLVKGKADVHVVANGPLDRSIRLDATMKSDDVTLLGQHAKKLRACYNHDPKDPLCQEAVALAGEDAEQCVADSKKGGRCLVAGIDRTDGGAASIVARTDAHDHLAGHVAVDALPLDVVAEMAGKGQLPAGGQAALSVDLGGTLANPTADGTLGLLRTWVYGAFLGDEQFQIHEATSEDPAQACDATRVGAPPVAGKLALCGSLEDGRLVVAMVLGTGGTMPVRARVDLRRVEIDPFVDLHDLIGAPDGLRAWTTGSITVDTELAKKDAPLSVQLELPELAILVPNTDEDGRPAPLVIRTEDSTPLSVHFDGKNFTLGRPVTFATPAGDLTLSGKATAAALDLAIDGKLQLGELQPLLATWFDDAKGSIAVNASVTGTFAAPRVEAHLDLASIELRPIGQDLTLSVDKASVDLTPDHGLAVSPFDVLATDPSSGEQAKLAVNGGVQLDGLTPRSWNLVVDGRLAGKVLEAFAPTALAQASGIAHVHLDASRTAAGDTFVNGDLTFNARHPFVLMPRGLHREIILSGGSVSFTEDGATLSDVSGSIDGDGAITDVSGEIALEHGAPVSGRISLNADGIPFKIPHTLDLVVSAAPLTIQWDKDRDGDGIADMRIGGSVAIVQGVYEQDIEISDLVKPTETSGPAPAPVWDTYPMLGAAKLDIGIDARSLSVKNNLADIDLTGAVTLSGTPKDPRLDGQITVVTGRFTPPLSRATFDDTHGSASFTRTARFPDESPTLAITSSTTNFRDSNGQNVVVTFTLGGTITHPTWDLTTSNGLNKGQALQLMITGQAQTAVTSKATDILSSDQTQVSMTTDAGGAADQVIKDVAGNAISLLIGDPLQNVHLFDVERWEVGPGSIGFHGERMVVPNTNVVGDVEQTVRGRTYNVRVEIKSTFGLSMQLGYLDKNYDDPAEQDVKDLEAKFVYHLPIP